MLAATAAIFPFAMATSRTALILFLGSMRWPPFKRRSYFCCAETWLKQKSTTASPDARLQTFNPMTSSPAIVVPPGTPLRHQVLAHVERSGHRVCRGRAVEAKTQGIAVPLGIRTGNLNAAPVDGAGKVARHEVALMCAF